MVSCDVSWRGALRHGVVFSFVDRIAPCHSASSARPGAPGQVADVRGALGARSALLAALMVPVCALAVAACLDRCLFFMDGRFGLDADGRLFSWRVLPLLQHPGVGQVRAVLTESGSGKCSVDFEQIRVDISRARVTRPGCEQAVAGEATLDQLCLTAHSRGIAESAGLDGSGEQASQVQKCARPRGHCAQRLLHFGSLAVASIRWHTGPLEIGRHKKVDHDRTYNLLLVRGTSWRATGRRRCHAMV